MYTSKSKIQRAWKLLVDYFAYLIIRSVAVVVEVLPSRHVRGIVRFLSWLSTDLLKIRRRVLEENLQIAFPEATTRERHKLIRDMWEHVFLLGYEILLTSRKIHETNWRHYVQLRGHHEVLRHILCGRPIILVTGHFGNFEIGGYVLSLLGLPLSSVARPIDNPFLDRFLSRLRSGAGQMLIPKVGATEAVDEAARQGKLIAFLADQSAGPKGCFVDFFGRKASTFKAVAILSLTHKAPVAVCYAIRRGGLFQFELRVVGLFDPARDLWPPHDVFSITQWYTRLLEEGIRSAPEQYWWIHRRWKEKPPHRAKKPTPEASNAKAAA